MKYDGYNVDWFDYTSAYDGGKRYGVKVEDMRRFDGVTLSGYASIPERDTALREWIEQQETKPVIVEGPVVLNLPGEVEWAVNCLERQIGDCEDLLEYAEPWPRDCYHDDANYQHGVRIAKRRRELLAELISSYRAELRVIQAQLQELEKHGGS